VRFLILSLFLALSLVWSNNLSSSLKKAPSFVLLNNKNQYVYKSKLKGNLIIAFWASYCLPCLNEIPELIKLEKKYASSKKLKLVLINVDVDNQDGKAIEKANEALAGKGIKHDFLLDLYHKTIERYHKSKKVPLTFLVNKKGYILFKSTGMTSKKMKILEQKIKKL